MLQIQNAVFQIAPQKHLHIEDIQIQTGECGVIIGNNGSGKTMLSCALNGELTCLSGKFHKNTVQSSLVSFEKQLALFDEESYNFV